MNKLSSTEPAVQALRNIIFCLFAAGLNVKSADIRENDSLAKALGEVRWRVEQGGGGDNLRDWIRRERQLTELSV